jgi:hypothetical protein
MNRLLIFLLLLTGLLRPVAGWAQWRAVYDDQHTLDTLYALRHDTALHPAGGYFFPEYEFYDQAVRAGYVLTAAGQPTWVRAISRANVPSLGRVRPDTTLLFHRLWLQNVGTYTLYIADAGGALYSRQHKPAFDGYQLPLTETVSGWVRLPGPAALPVALQGQVAPWVGVSATPSDPVAPAVVVAAELTLTEQVTVDIPERHPFFTRLTGQPDALPPAPGSPYHSPCIARGTSEEGGRALHGTLRFVGSKSISAEMTLFRQLMQTALADYPFYAERHLDKAATRAAYDQLSRPYTDSTAYCDLVQATADWLKKTFRDGHFRIEALPKSCRPPAPATRTRRPVSLYVLNGQAYVMAVLDTTYSRQLPIGSRVVAIDGRPVESWFQPNGPANGYELTAPLDKRTTDSTYLTLAVTNGPAQPVLLRHNGKLSIPPRFRPQHGECRLLTGDVAYFRINNWFLDVYLRFLNHWPLLEKSRGLVIDLRGNGGGTALSAYRLLSVLVDAPAWVYGSRSKRGQAELVVRPDTDHPYATQKPIVILCDKGTACSSELFIRALRRNRPNVQVVGTDNTPGILAQRIDLWFPSGLVFYTDHISPRVEFEQGYSLEATGLQPDHYVRYETLDDLRPFSDRTLRLGADLIRQHHRPALVEKKP